MKKFIAITLLFVISGCASTQHKPLPDGYTGPKSTVKDTKEQLSNTKVYFFQATHVDGRGLHTSLIATLDDNFGQGLSMRPRLVDREIPSGKSTLKLEGVTHHAAPILALKGGNYSIRGEVTVDLKANKKYYVKGKLSVSRQPQLDKIE